MPTYCIRSVLLDRLVGTGFARQSADIILRRLINNGILGEQMIGATSTISFSLDPVAEYLAAAEFVERNLARQTVLDATFSRAALAGVTGSSYRA